MCDVSVFDIYFTEFGTALTTILPILFQYCYKYCYSDSRNLWAVMKGGVWRFKIWWTAFMCSNAPAAHAYEVYILQVIRYSRACGFYQDFRNRGLLLTSFWNYGSYWLSGIRVITKLPNSEQSYKGKVKTHKYINRQNQSTTGKLWKP
jgi:hypothetical protein